MDSSSTSTFRFRDHQETGDSFESDTNSDISYVSGDGDNESEPESMTGKGIKRLCSELLELKRASDEDFYQNIYSNYSAFLRIFDDLGGLEYELIQLKHYVSTQKKHVTDLIDGIYMKALSKDTLESMIEESPSAEPSSLSKLEVHTTNVLETLDTLLSENRLDEALAILEMEDGNFEIIQLEENSPSHVLTFYNSAIAERKIMLARQLILVAQNSRVRAPELQKALLGLCIIGESHLATQLLLKYYHLRLAAGIRDFQCSKSFFHGVYIREVSKFVFSMISQAARSFVMLHGESSYASELIQWAGEETEVFASLFIKYVKSISEISGGLSTAVEAVKFAMSFCSLLKTQRIVLQPSFINHIRPCMDEVLQIHINHFKKVIGIFTANDAWVLGRYLVSGILNNGCSSMVVGQQLEYCLLTNSGRKFVTLLQAITEDVSPLVSLQMEGSILKGLTDLYTEYISLLRRAITRETRVIEEGGSRISLAETLLQQISVIANTSTLVHLFSSIVRGIFNSVGQEMEIDSGILTEAYGGLRAHFCQQFISKMMFPVINVEGQTASNNFNGLMPSIAYQVLFSEVRKLEKLGEDNVVEVDWLIELLRELVEAILDSISNDKQIWTATGDFKQFVLDMQFLVEIAGYGGFLSANIMNASLDLVSRMKLVFLSAELDPKREVNDEEWDTNAATEAIKRLLEVEETNCLPNEEPLEEVSRENQPEYPIDSFEDDASTLEDSIESEDIIAIDATETEVLDVEVTPVEGSLEFLEDDLESSDSKELQNQEERNVILFDIVKPENNGGKEIECSQGMDVTECDGQSEGHDKINKDNFDENV